MDVLPEALLEGQNETNHFSHFQVCNRFLLIWRERWGEFDRTHISRTGLQHPNWHRYEHVLSVQ